MLYNSSSEDISFPHIDEYIDKTKIKKPEGKSNKKCLIIIIIIGVLIILIVGIILVVYFGSKNKEDGGFITLFYTFKKTDQDLKLFELENLKEDDFEVEYNKDGDNPLRFLKDSKKYFKAPGKCKEGICNVTVSFKKVVSNLEGMFANVQELKLANFSSFNSKKIINMDNLFSNCTGLKKVDFSNFNAENLESMDSIFENCTSITEIDLNDFITPRLSSMKSAFKGCSNLVSLDIEHFIIQSKVFLEEIFQGCKHLVNLIAPIKYNEEIRKIYNSTNITDTFCVEGKDCETCANKIIGDSKIKISTCEKCSPGYFKYNKLDLEFECKECKVENCTNCDDEYSCKECENSYYLSKDDNNNDICLYNESSINNTSIVSTIPDFGNSDLPSDDNLL